MEDIVVTKIEHAVNTLLEDPTDRRAQAIRAFLPDFFKLRHNLHSKYWEKIKVIYEDLKKAEHKVYASKFMDVPDDDLRDQLSSFQYDDISAEDKVHAWLVYFDGHEEEISEKIQSVSKEIMKAFNCSIAGCNFATLPPHHNAEQLIGLCLGTQGNFDDMGTGLLQFIIGQRLCRKFLLD